MRITVLLIVVLSALAAAAQNKPAKPSTDTVTVTGSVRISGIYPVRNHGEQITVMAVIEQAGGLLENADDDVYILRFFRSEKTSQAGTETVRISLAGIRNGKAKDVPLQAGDVLTIPAFSKRRRNIFQ